MKVTFIPPSVMAYHNNRRMDLQIDFKEAKRRHLGYEVQLMTS
jgi:hypothetical protein